MHCTRFLLTLHTAVPPTSSPTRRRPISYLPQELMAHCRQQRRLFSAAPPYSRLVA